MVQPVVKSADRVLDILELLASEPNGLTLSEIADRLGIARSSTHGLVHTLRVRGFVSPGEGGRFQSGVRLIQLGLNVADRLELRSVAHPRLEALVNSTQDTALLVVPSDGDLLYVDKVISDARDVRTDPRMSMNRPFHCSSLGKALLATLDDDTVRAVYDGGSLPAMTEFSITDLDVLLEDLAATRARGYATDRQEAVAGVWCVGAPIRDHTGLGVAAVSVSTIREFFDPDTTGPLVLDAALDISWAMGWRGDAASLYLPVAGAGDLIGARQVSTAGSSR
jgi:IclR family acetate operon transcriptional repressor